MAMYDVATIKATTKNRSSFRFNKLNIIDNSKFSNPDNDFRGDWTADPFDAPNIRENLSYPIKNPNTQEIFYPPKGRCWRMSQEKFNEALADNRIVFGKTGKSKPQYKRFKFEAEEKGQNVNTIWLDCDTATRGTQELKSIFDNEKIFDTPKPLALLTRILEIATDKNSIILDSFAGSGTTAHAVLELNKKDGGNRKFILVEMEDYAENITAERVRRVIKGYGKEPENSATGGDFSFYELGDRLLEENGNLNENISIEKIREYIYFSETKEKCEQNDSDFLGECNGVAYYLAYNRNEPTTLNIEYLAKIKKASSYVVYADACVLSEDTMMKYNITFKKIPRDIKKV